MPSSRSSARNWLEFAVVKSLLAVAARTPLGVSLGLAGVIGRVAPRSRATAERNLSMALPALDAVAVTDGVFESIGRMLYYFSRFPTRHAGNIGEWIECEGLEHFHRAKAAGRGVLFATGHFGNWELSALAHGFLTEPMTVVIRTLDNPRLDRLVNGYRTRSGNQIVGKEGFQRRIVSTLRANGAVGILVDQNVLAHQGVFVDFFGVPACTGTAFAKLAHRTGAAVLPGAAIWNTAKGKYVLRFDPVLPMSGDVLDDTARITRHIEQMIRRDPAQWLWIHRRWSTRPLGDAPFPR